MPVFRSLKHRCAAIGAVVGIALAASVPLVSGSASAAAGVTTFDQCQNGAVGSPPALVACAGSAWANGNLNGNNSHWAEGDFVPYRVAISGLAAGSHDLEITYRPGDSGAHAIDYLGSYDYTETTSATSNAMHQNHADPCSDITMGSGWCNLSSPASVSVKSPDFTDADANCKTAGSFTGSQVAGAIDLFGPSGSTMSFNYVSENVSHGGGCDTTVDVGFTLPSDIGSNNIVIAWGGHVASAQNWGAGNSASGITGSPYHMSLDSVDGAPTGSMDRSMQTDALYTVPSTPDPGSPVVTPTTTTVVKDGVTNQAWGGTEMTGATAYDTASISGTDGPVPTGTLTYTFFGNGNCQGSGTTETVTLVDGVPHDATPTAALGAGPYSYDAVYNGDGNYNPSAVGACEPFAVLPAPTSVSNIVFSKQTGQAWSGTEVAGGKANDTAALGGAVPGFVPTGTVTYSYFANGTCGGTPVWTDAVTLTGAGGIPDSNVTDALAAGTYSFDAAYGGDSNYAASGTSACEAFVVTPNTGSPSVDPLGSSDGTGGGGSTGGAGASASTPASDPSTPAAAAAAPAATPAATAAAPAPAAATTPAGPVTKPSELAWTGADIGVTAAIGLGLLGLGCFLLWSSRRRRHEVG